MPDVAVRTAGGHAPDAEAMHVSQHATPARGTLALTGLLVGLVLAAQVPLAISLMHPDVAFEAYHAAATLAVNAALALISVLGAALLPGRRRALALVPGALVASAMLGAAVTVGGHLWDAAAALLAAAAAWWLGRALLRALHVAALQDVVAVDVVLGMGVLGLGVLALGRLDAITWWTVGIPTLLLGAAGLRAGARSAWRRRASAWAAIAGSPIGTACAGLLLLQLGWTIVWLSAPEIQFDALSAKAYLPQLWADIGSIGPLLLHPILNVTGLAQVVAVPEHALGAPDVGRWLQLIAAGLLVATTWWWGRRSPVGPLAALLVGVVPEVVWQSTTAYDDLLLALGAVALFVAVVRTMEPAGDDPAVAGPSLATAIAVGAVAGTCVWLKLNLLVLTGALAAGWLLLAGPPRTLARRAAGLALGALPIAAPALVLRWIDTGNPVFPTYNTIFKSPHYPLINEQFNFPFWPHATLLDALRAPYESVVDPSLVNSGTAVGMYGALVAALVAAALIGWRGAQRRALLVGWISLLLALALWWVQFRYLRYLLPTAMVAVLLLVLQLRAWRPGRAGTALLLGAVALASIAYLPSTVASFWNVPHRNVPFAAAFGRWAAQDYLRHVFPEKDVLDAFQRLAPPGASALSDAHEQTFLHDRDLSAPWEVNRLLQLSGAPPATPDDAVRRLRRLGIAWAMIDTTGSTTATFPWIAQALRDGRLVFSANGWQLYRLAPRSSAG